MQDNVYAPPLAPVAEPAPLHDHASDAFYVVAPVKFVALFVATMGLYQYYWSYMHWARFRRMTKAPMWPVARAIFSIFFAHSLNSEIDHRLRRTAAAMRWAPGALATLYVVSALVAAVLDRLSWNGIGSPTTDVAALAMLVPIGYSMLRSQQAANASCGDAAGARNSRFTAANWCWIVGGAALWALIAFGLFVHVQA